MRDSDNKYINCYNKLFQMVFMDEPVTGFFKKREFKNNLYKMRNKIADEIHTVDMDYHGLRDYVQFIMYLEKVFVYPNNPALNRVSVTSPTDAQRQEMVILSNPCEDIKKSPFVAKIATYYDYNDPRNVVEIEIVRATNRRILNRFIVADGKTDMTNPFDFESIIILNNLTREYFYDLFMEYSDMIINGSILDFKNRSRYDKIDYPPI